MGPFPITQLDAARLRSGQAAWNGATRRAARVRRRVAETLARMKDFPATRNRYLDENDEAEERFAAFADEEPCPALDPTR